MKCTNCQTTLLPDARFCHSCGEKVKGSPTVCPSCTAINVAGARFCTECGCALSSSHTTYTQQQQTKTATEQPKYPLDFEDTVGLSEEIKGHFMSFFNQKIKKEHNASKLPDYRLCLYESGFIKNIELKSQQLAEDAYTIHSKQSPDMQFRIDQLLTEHFNALTDYFLVEPAAHLNEFPLPEAILKYAGKRRNEVDIEQMIYDYLEWDKHPKEKFYTNFLTMPEHKIRNAAQSFLQAERKEKIYLLCDQTVFGSCKEGFAITERGLYWKAHFNKAHSVYYENLTEIEKEKDWITINGRYFHVNKEFDFRMMKLLLRLKEMF